MSDYGKSFESEITDLCGDIFLKDYVLASPMFRTQKGKLREAADALVPSGDTLIALQVKTRQTKSREIEEGGPELNRIAKKVSEAAEQVKTVRRAFESGTFETARTLRGAPIPLGGRPFRKIIGVVVFDVITTGGESLVEQVECMGGYTEVNGIPVHILRAPDFRQIVNEQDTPPDFVNYLECRGNLFAGKKIIPFVSELDLFGLFKTRFLDIEKVLKSDSGMLAVEPGLWEGVRAKLAAEWRERDERIKSSYVIDLIIGQVHSCIDFDPRSEDPNVYPAEASPSGPSGGLEYWEIVQRLGRLTRIERAQFGEKVFEKLHAADTKPISFTLIYRFPDVGPLVFLASKKPRAERIRILQHLMKCAAVKCGTSQATGVTTQAFSSEKRCHDFAVLRDLSFPDIEAAKVEAAKWFGPGKVTSLDEWGRDYAADP